MRHGTGTGRRPRAARLTAGLLGGAALLAVAGLLAAAGFVVWMFDVAVPSHRDDTEAWELAAIRRQAAETEQRLRAAARDGELTDAEIAASAQRQWAVERGERELSVVTRFPASAAATRCYRYTFALPLGPNTAVARSESASCPEVG
jgi:hypothetical protein